ncbi:NAD-dependent epimerase/dehydratase family protein [Tenacibaculum tangerinum]|uniref:NAD-dependent epimerase/dehydratase family protein n=1 Tax=Tenacibaculum tangerinum TaxID=3038772 RepID=A0ABY8LA13_9FLAO|nr:NAD-dependent epimerase/dehydratase family protein [Tenacibaculum tangerinum]WGH76979.1 NAD-dependent epimerase/dehydratase family protein [Tenacibaculum tangerinum]
MKHNLIITGISGFVGQNLENYLNKQYVLDGVSRSKIDNNLSYKDLSKELLSSYNTFIHLAGKAHDLKNTSEEKEYFEVNTELTKTLFDNFLNSDCEVFIYMSSVKATADEVEGILDENHKSNPVTAYGKSKLAAEQYILSKEIPENKRVYILRPCMIHGPNNKGNLNLLYNFVSKGIPYPLGKYENKRSFLAVENLCFVIKELVENKDIQSGVYNVADDESLSTNELVKTIGVGVNKNVRIFNTPKVFINMLAKLGDILSFPINSERVQKLTEDYVVSNKKIKSALGINEFPLSTREGIIKTIKSFTE